MEWRWKFCCCFLLRQSFTYESITACRIPSALSRYHPLRQVALEGLGSRMLGDVAVRRKAVASDTVAQADAFQWTVVFLSKVLTVWQWSSGVVLSPIYSHVRERNLCVGAVLIYTLVGVSFLSAVEPPPQLIRFIYLCKCRASHMFGMLH